MSIQVTTADTRDELARRVAREVCDVLSDAQQQRGRASLALTGGTMGAKTVAALAAVDPSEARVPDWRRVDVWWSDERFLPAGDPERNAQQALEAVRAVRPDLDLPPERLHVIGSSEEFDSPEAAAADCLDELRAAAAAEGSEDGLPTLDVALLGVGPDGHVASVFPGSAEAGLEAQTVVGVHGSPKPPPERVTMTLPLISRAHHVWFVVAGEDKADAVARLLSGAPVAEIPACGVGGDASTVLFATPDALGSPDAPAGP